MEWIAVLKGKTVGLDTTPLIYFIEENPTYLKTVRPFFEALSHGEFSAVTSVVTLLEVLVHLSCGVSSAPPRAVYRRASVFRCASDRTLKE